MVTPEARAAHLTEVRNLKMARSAHAYVRGSTAKFYDWLNAGPVAVQIRDLDQTVIGNPAHDLIRLGLSLASAARGSDLPGVTTARILEHLAAGYLAALTAVLRDGQK